jgi:hypothetical protein
MRQPRVVGRVRGADGAEQDVYEDAAGRQYVIGAQGEKVFGLWLARPGSTPPPPPDEDDAPPRKVAPRADDEADEDLPWVNEDGVRRDSESHRGRLLGLLGTVSFGCGVLSVPCFPFGVAGLALGLYVRLGARGDLRKMHAGEMDRAGAGQTEAAMQDATTAMALSALGLFLWIVLGTVGLFLMT